MSNTRIPSPARSQGAGVTPRRHNPRRTLSVGSARSNTSGRLSSIIQQYKNDVGSFATSPMVGRRSLLTDDTDIDEPRRKSWWKKLNENSRDVMEVLEDNNVVVETKNVVEEFIDIEILSQEKKNYTLDLPESSDSESINSIVMPQRKLFTQKEIQPQKKFGQLIETRETLPKLHKTNDAGLDNIVNAGTKALFQGNKQRSRPVFPSALLNISPNKTAADKTKEMATAEPKGQVRNFFGQRLGTKRKNIFANFIVSESEDEIPEIQPRVFGFQKEVNTKARRNSVFRGARDPSPTSSITTDIDMDDWNHLPSSTMVENQLEDGIGGSTPVKRARLSKLSEAKESDAGTNTNATADKTKVSNRSVSSKNKARLSSNLREKTFELNKSESSKEKSKDSHNYAANIPAKNQENGNKSQSKSNDLNKSVSSNVDVSNKTQVPRKPTKDVSRSKLKNIESNHKESDYNQNQEKKSEVILEIEQDIDTNDGDNNFTLEYEHDENDHVIETEINQQNYNVINKILPTINVNEIRTENTNLDDISNKETTTLEQEQLKVCEIIGETEKSGVLQINKKNHGSKVKNNCKEVQSAKQDMGSDGRNVMEINMDHEDHQGQNQSHAKENKKQNDSAELTEEKMEVGVDNNIAFEPTVSENKNQSGSRADKEESLETQNVSKLEQEKNQEIENVMNLQKENEEDQMVGLVVQNKSEEDEQNQSQEAQSEIEEQNEDVNESLDVDSEIEYQGESQEVENQSEEEISKVHNDIEEKLSEIEEEQNGIEEELNESQETQNESQEEQDDSQLQNASDDEEKNISQDVQEEEEISESEEEDQNNEMSEEQSEEEMEHNDIETETPNVSHDTTGRNRNKDQSPEAILHDKTNQIDSFTAQERNTSIRKTKSIIKNLNIRPSLAPIRESIGISDGTTNSSVERSGWDSHRTTRKTLRQTFGKDFTPRKSLRALVMEKSAKRHTVYNEVAEKRKLPQANNTELAEDSNQHVADDIMEESDHEISIRTRQTILETYLQKIKKQNMEERLKMKEAVRSSLKINVPAMDILNPFKVPAIPARRTTKTHSKPKSKPYKSSLVTLGDLPPEVIEDLKYKPPKRFRPSNASWITKRLYKFLETKLEPKYDYKARVRAEKLVETLYNFVKDLRRHQVAPSDAVDVLKHEMARLDIVKTHFEFNQFFHDYMPREIRIKVIPDIVNKISLPRHGIFSDILRETTTYG